jgi:hypothetical protein
LKHAQKHVTFVQVVLFDYFNLYQKFETIINTFYILGAKSLLQLGTSDARAKYDQIITTHQCGKNFDQSSGNMEASCTLKMFQRSQKRHGVRYVKYVGDGDSKTFSVLKKEKPYNGANKFSNFG